jgi:transcriptional regulator with AAA-type ATPase domain
LYQIEGEKMSKATVYIVGDEAETANQAKSYFGPQGVTVTSYTTAQWREGLEQPQFRSQLSAGTPALVVGSNHNSNNGGATNVLPFPVIGNNPYTGAKMPTMDEVESKTIEAAIAQFRGNLTEAAKALGIGRATLYRKVKQYHIDPSASRKKRAA